MKKKIAIFHDYFSTVGGAEKLVSRIARLLGADIITTDVEPECVSKGGFENIRIIELGKNPATPGIRELWATFRFLTTDFSDKYDFFILSGNWAHYSAFHHHPNLYYCHTPTRVFFDLREAWLSSQKGIKKIVAYLWASMHSKFEKYSISNVDKIVVNSKNVQERVKKFYKRNSEIIYTAVPTADYYFKEVGDFWLAVNRLYPHKRIELQLEIFNRLPSEKLKIVGGYDKGSNVERYVKNLKLPKNVEFLGEISERELIELYARCKGVIATARDEDLGYTPLEAMASGKAVLATDEGGYRETIINNLTGWLLQPTQEAFANKIKGLTVRELSKMKEDCLRRARDFDESIFRQKLEKLIES